MGAVGAQGCSVHQVDLVSSADQCGDGVIESGAQCHGLDQVPEALLPLLVVAAPLGLNAVQIAGVTLVFYALELPLARLLFRLGIRERPY